MLNPVMLAECKDIIFNQSKLPESVKEPVHMAINHLIVLEHGYKDFLSRELVGEGTRAGVASMLITDHGGDDTALIDWFMGYENATEEQKAAGTAAVWGS